jgi:hypothetical protein
MCKANMAKNSFVLKNMDKILDCLTRGLDLRILTEGYGTESRGVTVSYQAQAACLSAVLPSNSPGVHTLWLPAIPLQLGLVLKPGPQEPWTPYRMMAAFIAAGIPKEVFAMYPGGPEAGAAVLAAAERAMIFGGTQTVEQYKGNPRVQAHGPGFSKILLGDDIVDNWPQYLDLMVESIYIAVASTAPVSGPRGIPRKSRRRSPSGSGRSKSNRRLIPQPASPPSPCLGKPRRCGE